MQPSSAASQYQPGPDPRQGGADRTPRFAPPPPTASLVRVRPWLVGTVAAITVLVLIAAIANQGVTDEIRKHALSSQKFFDNVVQSTTVFSWRFSPQLSSDFGHVWLGGIVFDVLVVLLTLVFTAALAKNKRGFGGAFLATWVSVFFATAVSAYVRATIVDVNTLTQQNLGKPVQIFFAPYSPGQYSTFAGLVLGLVAALIAGAVAAATARTEVLAAPGYPSEYPAPGPPGGVPGRDVSGDEVRARQQPERSPQLWTAPPPGPITSPSPWTEPTTEHDRDERRGAVENEPQPTAVLPVVDDSPASTEPSDRPADRPVGSAGSAGSADPADPAGSDGDATTQLPAYGSGTPDDSDATQAYRLPREDDQPPHREP